MSPTNDAIILELGKVVGTGRARAPTILIKLKFFSKAKDFEVTDLCVGLDLRIRDIRVEVASTCLVSEPRDLKNLRARWLLPKPCLDLASRSGNFERCSFRPLRAPWALGVDL